MLIGDMPAGQSTGPLEGEADALPAAVTANEAPSGRHAAAGVPPVGLRPPFVTPAAAHSHPDCRGILILIVALQLTPKVQQRSIDAYSITEVFPRLSRAALPIAITEATYTLEVRAIAAFAADATAALDAFVQGGASD
ncbi:hypothetical protein FNL56_07510 [Tardiphaga sp. vice304]|nr:hypothetical protein FNL56_07510 [Tardiphaga sp. vice304]